MRRSRPANHIRPWALALVATALLALAWLTGPLGRLLVLLALLLFAPGYLLERALRPRIETPFARPALWLALSLSSAALLYEWSTALHLHLTTAALASLLGLCALAAAAAAWHELGRVRPAPAGPAVLGWAGLLAVLALTAGTRFVQIQGLALPAWVDSVHHALMIRVAAERGQAPLSLYPYLPVTQLPYHWGYHVVMAAAMQLSGASLPQTMLWGGQGLNALSGLACAALAAALWRRPLAGVVAALVVGLVSIMPAYYVSWGRYTQLTGLLLLPAAGLLWQAALRAPSRGRWAALAVVLAGLSLVHVRVLLLTLALLAALLAAWAVREPAFVLRQRLLPALLAGALALALTAPWLALLAQRWLGRIAAEPGVLAGSPGSTALHLDILWAGTNRWLIALALAAALWGIARRRRAAAALALWVALVVAAANPWLLGYVLPAAGAVALVLAAQVRRWLPAVVGATLLCCNPALVRLPASWLLTNDVVAISLFVPLSALIGGGACLAWEALARRAASAGALAPRGARLAGVAALAALAIWGAWNQRSVVNPATVLATGADVAAIAWVAEHTPPDARFLINATEWQRGSDRAVDGGWWLLPLAGRWTSTPPVLYIFGDSVYVHETQERSELVRTLTPADMPRLLARMQRDGIGYVYLGTKPGALTKAMFAGNPAFETVYDAGGVTILALRHGA
jgi:hypothetical protein